jgi:hypothetical protein
MPIKVLKRHAVIASDGELVSLNTKNLTLVQKAHIRMVCEQKLQSFVQKRGIGIWDYRLLDDDPIPDSLRFLVLKAASGRCQLCGILAKERPIDVDHIIPGLAAARTNWPTCKPFAANATVQSGIRIRAISGHGSLFRSDLCVLPVRIDVQVREERYCVRHSGQVPGHSRPFAGHTDSAYTRLVFNDGGGKARR